MKEKVGEVLGLKKVQVNKLATFDCGSIQHIFSHVHHTYHISQFLLTDESTIDSVMRENKFR